MTTKLASALVNGEMIEVEWTTRNGINKVKSRERVSTVYHIGDVLYIYTSKNHTYRVKPTTPITIIRSNRKAQHDHQEAEARQVSSQGHCSGNPTRR